MVKFPSARKVVSAQPVGAALGPGAEHRIAFGEADAVRAGGINVELVGDAGARKGDEVEVIEKVKKGGKSNWTEITHGIPMPPHSRILTTAETERLVDWILSR